MELGIEGRGFGNMHTTTVSLFAGFYGEGQAGKKFPIMTVPGLASQHAFKE